MASTPLTIHATFFLKPGTEPQFFEAIKPLWEEIQSDDKLQYFNVFTNNREPGVIRLAEIWNANVEYLLTALPTRKNFQPFLDAIKDMQLKEHQTDVMTAVEGWKYVQGA